MGNAVQALQNIKPQGFAPQQQMAPMPQSMGPSPMPQSPTGGLGTGNSQLKQALAMMLSKIRR